MDSAVVILLVEDEALIQEVMEDALREAGYSVLKACSAKEAVRILDARSDQKFSALITDVNLSSSKTGWDVAHHARKLFPSLPVIYATTARADEWAANGVPKSVLLTKPFAVGQLVTAVSQTLNEAAMVSATSADHES